MYLLILDLMDSNEVFVNNLSIKAEPGLVWENNNRHEEEINEEVFNPALVENLDTNEKVSYRFLNDICVDCIKMIDF